MCLSSASDARTRVAAGNPLLGWFEEVPMASSQITRNIFRVRPCSFYFNADTATNDYLV
jgi:hypothetical protein